MDLLKEAGKYTEDQLLQMLSMSRVAIEVEKLKSEIADHKKSISSLEKKISKLESRKPETGRKKAATKKAPAKKRGRKSAGSKVTMNDAILTIMKNTRKPLGAADLAVGVKKAGYQTKSSKQGLSNRIYNELSKLEKTKAIKRVERGKYVIA